MGLLGKSSSYKYEDLLDEEPREETSMDIDHEERFFGGLSWEHTNHWIWVEPGA